MRTLLASRFTRARASLSLALGVLFGASLGQAQNTVFDDAFATDSLNPASYPTPTSTSTGWCVLSNKSAPNPVLADGVLTINMTTTTSGFVETQALFSSSAVELLPGTYIELVTTFVPTSVNLTGTENFIFGLYDSGGSAPLSGLQTSGLSSSLTTYATGGAKGWVGYTANIPVSGAPSMRTRPAQTGSNNTVQDVVVDGQSSSTGYTNPVAAFATSVGSFSSTFTSGSTYTLSYKLALSADGAALTATVALYNGEGTSGFGANSLVGTYSGTFTGANLLATKFDALAIGWRSNSNVLNNIGISSLAVKTTGGKPWLTTPPPDNVTVSLGSALTLPASAEGGTSYQWQVSHDGGSTFTDIDTTVNSSAATNTLTISSVANGDAGLYRLVVSNSLGSTTSTATTVTVTSGDVAPAITTQPGSRTAVTDGSTSFSVTANGTSPLVYQWQKSDNNSVFTDLTGANSATLSLTNVTTADAGYYRVVVSNSVGTVTSDAATLTVAPVIVTPPATSIVASGSAHTVSVTAEVGAGAPAAATYLWQRDGVILGDGGGITGTSTDTLQFSSLTAAQAGYYTVTVSNSAGSVTSEAVYVGVPSTETVTFAPGNNAAGISIDQPLRLVFPSAPKVGHTGVLRIHDASDDSVVASIDASQFVTFAPGNSSAVIPNAAIRNVQGGNSGTSNYYYTPIAVYGNEVWVTLSPTQRLAYGKTYYVTMDAALLLDSDNAAYPGISDTDVWRFSTKDTPLETPTASTGPVTITVGLDGTGDFATFQGAFDWIPQNNTLSRTIQVLPGVYRDSATLAQNRDNVTIVGMGAQRTDVQLIYPYAYFAPPGNVFTAGTLRIESSDVTVRNLTLDNLIYFPYSPTGWSDDTNTAFSGATNTLATTGKRLIFDNLLIKGGQDTIYAITGIGYYYGCEIWGSVDFIYGAALAVFDRCDIVQVRSTGGPVCAPSTLFAQPYGEVFLNCRFPRALVANGYPYDVNAGTTTFMRPWRQDGHVAIINSELGTHISTKGWGEWDGRENTCRAREYGSTLLGGGAAPTSAQRQAAGAYWVNTIDPDYTSTSMSPTDALLVSPGGITNRQSVDVAPADYTLEAIFGHAYFALDGWMPVVVPSISTQPASQDAASGQSVTFTVVGYGTPAPTYQWHKNGVAIVGATDSSYTIASVTADDAADYTVVLTNSEGSVTSTAATLSVGGISAAPIFSTQPTSQSVDAGTSVTFTAAASGSPAYQWKKDNVDITGATSASYTIGAATTADAGSYTVVATNAGGSATSDAAVLTVTIPAGPTITSQPSSQSVTVGAAVSFTVAATGSGTLAYQWQKEINGEFTNVPFVFTGNDPTIITDLSGITAPTLSFVHAQVIDAGNYRVLVTDSNGTTASSTVSFAVKAAPVGTLTFDGYAGSVTGGGSLAPVVVTTAAALKSAAESSSAAVITVSGVIDLGSSGRISVKSNKTIRGADSGATILGTLSLSSASNVIIANLNISARTGARASNDGITVGSGSTNVLITKCTIFNCTDGNLDVVNGSDNVTISWCKFYYTRNTTHNFSNLIGSSDTDTATSPYRVTWHHNWWGPGCKQRMLACRFGGAHMFNNYWSCAGNDYCSTSRNIAEMLSEHNVYNGVKDPLAKEQSGLLKTIGNVFTACTGKQTVSADVLFTPTYSYRLDRAADVQSLVTAGAGNVGTAAPAAESLAISGSTSVATGGSITLTAASGYASYQWRFKNEAIAGATSATYTISSAQSAHAGAYTVVGGFTGRSDFVVSSPLVLSVTTSTATPPSITTQPASQSVTVGESVSFTVVASGDAPLAYQWQKDVSGTFTDIAGATSATFTLASTKTSDAGTYRVVVTNNAGSATSASATLTVNDPNYAVTAPDGFAAGVTGGGTAAPGTVTTAAAFKAAVEASGPAVITVSGTLTLSGGKVAVKSDKTIQGADGLATIIGCLDLGSGGVSNVLIRGLTITNPAGDGITVRDASNVFITHCTVFDCSDGLIDINNGSDNVTVSWCEFYYTAAQADHRFTMIVGSAGAETKPLRITLHHNWWSDRCDQRMPSGTFGYVHLYNNYFTSTGNSYATNARADSQFLVERSVYVGVKDPLYKEGGGLIRSIDNVFTDTTGLAPDAGADLVFTPSYSYKLQPAAGTSGLDVATMVAANAGNTAGLNSVSPVVLSAAVTGPAAGASQTVSPGGSVTLTASFTGFTAASYQWRLHNFPIANATASSYVVADMDAAKAGAYTVAIALESGELVVSTPFDVALGTGTPPTITTQPASVTVTAGASASFTVVATGDAPFTYQWRKASVAIAGATSATYAISATQVSDAGEYTVVVSNAAGSATGNAATLTVNAASTPPPSDGGGGGGAPSLWFWGMLVVLAAVRRVLRSE